MEFDLQQKVKIFGYELSLLTVIVGVLLLLLFTKYCVKKVGTPSPTAETFEDSQYETIDEPKDEPLNLQKEGFTEEHTCIAYNFNTEWCGFSRQFQSVWDEFSSSCGSIGVKAVDVKCDDDNNAESKSLCEQYRNNIPGFPTVLFVKEEQLIEYRGSRTKDALMEFASSL